MKTYILEERVGTKTSTRKANSVKQICTMLKSTLRFHGSKAIVTAYEAPATPQEEQEGMVFMNEQGIWRNGKLISTPTRGAEQVDTRAEFWAKFVESRPPSTGKDLAWCFQSVIDEAVGEYRDGLEAAVKALDLIAARTDQKSIKGIANGVYGTKARAALNPEKEEK